MRTEICKARIGGCRGNLPYLPAAANQKPIFNVNSIKRSSEVAKRYLTNLPALPASKTRDKWDASSMVKERNELHALLTLWLDSKVSVFSLEAVAEVAWENSVEMFNVIIYIIPCPSHKTSRLSNQ